MPPELQRFMEDLPVGANASRIERLARVNLSIDGIKMATCEAEHDQEEK